MLGDRQRGMGGRAVTVIISLLAAYVFGSTAWQQFAAQPQPARAFFTGLFAVCGGGAIWLVYGLVRLVLYLVRRVKRE